MPTAFVAREPVPSFRFDFLSCRAGRLALERVAGEALAHHGYVRDPGGRVYHAMGMLVLTLAGDQISAITRFDNSVLARFGLPRKLPG